MSPKLLVTLISSNIRIMSDNNSFDPLKIGSFKNESVETIEFCIIVDLYK